MERLSKCIHEWMRAEDLTVGRLTDQLGFKSKTSVYRLLNDKSNYQSCARFCSLIAPGLDAYWENRFRRALTAEKIGVKRYALLEALNLCLFDSSPAESGSSFIGAVPFHGGTVTVLGCIRPGLFALIDELLTVSDQVKVTHYITHRDLLESPDLLPGLISHVTEKRYSAVLLDSEGLNSLSVPWNIFLWSEKKEACTMLNCIGEYAWQPLPGGASYVQNLLSLLDSLSGTILYRYEDLETNQDYMEFTEQNYRMEYNRKTLIFKPTPGIQMLPAGIVEQTFFDFLSDNPRPVSAVRDTLAYTLEKRVRNFYSRTKPTYLMLSLESMLRFMRTGMLDDQFFALRSFTEAERVSIVQRLEAFSREKPVSVSFRENSWPVSVEVYDGFGVLFYPSASNYNARESEYRELFLPGKDYTDLFFQFADVYGFFDEDSRSGHDDVYGKLLNVVKAPEWIAQSSQGRQTRRRKTPKGSEKPEKPRNPKKP